MGLSPRHLREIVMGGVGIAPDPPPPAGIKGAREEEDGGIDIRRRVAPRDPGVPGSARDHGDITVVEDLPDTADEREGPGAAREEGDHGYLAYQTHPYMNFVKSCQTGETMVSGSVEMPHPDPRYSTGMTMTSTRRVTAGAGTRTSRTSA